MNTTKTDVIIIGGGYYGCAAALEFKTARPDLNVVILEQESRLFRRASNSNQGQLHAGYMYSGFPELARECAHSAKEFIEQYGDAVNRNVLTYYGVHNQADIPPEAYESFCRSVGLPLRRLKNPPVDFFGPALNAVYETAEKTFSNYYLQKIMNDRLTKAGVKITTRFTVESVQPTADGLKVKSADGRTAQAQTVVNAAFADSNAVHERSGFAKLPLEHAVFLHFLVDVPEQYRNMGIIVVRGAFGALVPLKNGAGSHIFAHGALRLVRTSRIDAPQENVDPKEIGKRFDKAVADAAGYLPVLKTAQYRGYTLGTRTNYINPATGQAESRAVVLKHYNGITGYHCVIGGKVTCLPEITSPVRQIAKELV